jgi:hypothetical protein
MLERRVPTAFASAILLVLSTGACTSTEVGDSDDTNTNNQGEEHCDRETIGEESGDVLTIYRVENGQLGEVCLGRTVAVLEETWDVLTQVAPPEQLDAVELFSGFQGDGETLAFTGPVDGDNDAFLVAVDVESADLDFDELRLTIIHELAHVFTQTPDQLDTGVSSAACDTFHNGLGCFEADSYLWLWIGEFWSEIALASLPDGGVSIDEPGGEDRCNRDPSFLGPYSASHPEEDFAESFSAFVFSVDVPAGIDPKLDFFTQRPELVGFRDRASAADLDGLPNNFEHCG